SSRKLARSLFHCMLRFGGVATSAFVVLVIFPVLYYYRNVGSLTRLAGKTGPSTLKEATT
ncbi:MAG: hypothetical protein OXN96_16105, partial [Bryobacterales bacterium]|nr:hypothetical protein [Bryobacterales bacterium]